MQNELQSVSKQLSDANETIDFLQNEITILTNEDNRKTRIINELNDEQENLLQKIESMSLALGQELDYNRSVEEQNQILKKRVSDTSVKLTRRPSSTKTSRQPVTSIKPLNLTKVSQPTTHKFLKKNSMDKVKTSLQKPIKAPIRPLPKPIAQQNPRHLRSSSSIITK